MEDGDCGLDCDLSHNHHHVHGVWEFVYSNKTTSVANIGNDFHRRAAYGFSYYAIAGIHFNGLAKQIKQPDL